MNIEQYADNLDCFIEKVRQARFYDLAVRDTIAKQSERIFIDGKASDGAPIGQYDTKRPLYANPKKVPNGGGLLPLTGKTGKSEFKSGKKHKTRYIESYKQLRELMGLQTSKVDLVFFGNLKSDFENGGRGAGIIPLKVNNRNFQTTLDSENENKRSGLESRFRTVFNLTKEEEENIGDIAQKELTLELDRCLQNH